MWGILVAVLFIALNGFFVAAEFALVKLRATHQKSAKNADDPVARAVEKIDRYLSVTQLGITLASLGLGWVGEPAISSVVAQGFSAVVGRDPGKTGHTVIVAVAFTLLTFGHVLFGELVPKLIAIQRSHAVAKLSVLPLRITFYSMFPALWLLEKSSRFILSLVGVTMDGHGEAQLSEAEVLGVIAAHVAKGEGASDKQDLVRRLLRFSSRTAKLAMIQRADIAFLPLSASGQRAYEYLRQTEFSRVPLSRGEDLDQVVGYLYVKDFHRDPKNRELSSIEPLKRSVMFVPETQPLLAVLRDMQRDQTPFALVVDEFGGVSGLITMEDLLEEIVGEIRDELDVESARIERKTDGYSVDATVLLDEFVAETEADGVTVWNVGRHDDATTFAAAVVEGLGRVPRVGDHVRLGACDVAVLGVVRRRIVRVKVTIAAA